jgi:hypothetical protein
MRGLLERTFATRFRAIVALNLLLKGTINILLLGHAVADYTGTTVYKPMAE